MEQNFKLIENGCIALEKQESKWREQVFEFITNILNAQENKYIGSPSDEGGCGFALGADKASGNVIQVYIDNDGDIVVNTDNDNTKYFAKNGYCDLTNEELYSLCYNLRRYLTD